MSHLFIVAVMTLIALGIIGLIFYLYFIKRKEQTQVSGQFFTSSLGPIFYEALGKSGPYLVFIHGLGASSFCWRKIIPHFTKDYRVIVFDLWGFGSSCKKMTQPMSLDLQADILNALLDQLDIKKAHLICHSMGAQIAFWFALKYPERVEKIAAIAPATHPLLVSNQLQRLAWLAKFTPLVINRKAIKQLLARLLYDPAFVTEEMVDRYFQPYRDPDSHLCFAAALNILKDVRVFNQLASLKKDILILWGNRDKVVPHAFIKDIQNQLPHSQFKTNPSSGHLIFEDAPEWAVEQMSLFLKSS